MDKEIKFFLDKPKSTEPTFIFLYFLCNDDKLKYSSQIKILPSQWDTSSQLPADQGTHKKITIELIRLESIVEKYTESCRKMDMPVLKENLKRELDEKCHRVQKITGLSFYESVDILIKEAKEGKIQTKSGKRYEASTTDNWKKTRDKLYEFMPSLRFDEVSLETYFAFVKYCNDKNYASNYTDRIIKDWKTFMAWGITKGWHKNIIAIHPEFKRLREDVFKIYLNDDEIDLIRKVDLSFDKKTEIIRDRFIVNLYTGLRISDMKTLSDGHITNGTIVHINKKTGKQVVIPIHQAIEDIIKKHDGKLPKQYNDAWVNVVIKEVAKKCGLKDKIRYKRTVGGKTKEFVNEKWELVTNHTARRSLTTNLLKHANMLDVMPVTGMSLKTLQLYNKRSAEENAEMLKENPYFKRK